MPTPIIAELRKMSDDALIKAHDEAAVDAQVGVNYYLNELAIRDQAGQTETIIRYTRWIFWFTIVVTLTAVANVVIAWLLLRHP